MKRTPWTSEELDVMAQSIIAGNSYRITADMLNAKFHRFRKVRTKSMVEWKCRKGITPEPEMWFEDEPAAIPVRSRISGVTAHEAFGNASSALTAMEE